MTFHGAVFFAVFAVCLNVIAGQGSREILHECLRKPIELAEKDANVVFTGTIRDFHKDNEHPPMLKAEVEVKRVMKGSNVVKSVAAVAPPGSMRWNRKVVLVDGIGDPGICNSFAKQFDTRIFLLIKGENGDLKLNSSLVRLTLNNILRANAAVHGLCAHFFVCHSHTI